MTVTISIISTTKPASSIFSLTCMLKSRRAIAFERHDEDVAAVEHRDRHQVHKPRLRLIIAISDSSAIQPCLRRLARELRDADRPMQLPHRRRAGEQTRRASGRSAR